MNTYYINQDEPKILDLISRFAIKSGLEHKDSIIEIARQLHFSRQTIHNEIKRGTIEQMNTQLEIIKTYDPYAAQYKIENSLSYRGRMTVIDENHDLKEYIESKLKEGYTPEIIEHFLKDTNLPHISYKTIYNYLDSSILDLDNSVLPYKHKKRKKKKHKTEKGLIANGGISIDKRVELINSRVEFGHWEIDCVVGKRQGKSTCLMTLVERKTRYGIIMKIERKTKDNIVKALKTLKNRYGKYFYDIFKSITADNGSEFKDAIGMSMKCNNKEIIIFFAHAYHSWERGTNENFNRMIRRYIPKGTDISKISNKRIKEVQDKINKYPRKIFGYQSAYDMFQLSLQNICK